MIRKTAIVAFAGLAMAGCMGGGQAPVASQPPVTAAPVGRVEAAALPPPPAPGGPAMIVAASPAPSGVPTSARQPATAPSRMEVDGMRTAPGARESASLTNVSRVPSGGATGGSPLGGTVVSGHSAGVIPTTVDRNREPVRQRSTAPRDPMGPGTAPPIVAPELRDTTGRTLRNRQEVRF